MPACDSILVSTWRDSFIRDVLGNFPQNQSSIPSFWVLLPQRNGVYQFNLVLQPVSPLNFPAPTRAARNYLGNSLNWPELFLLRALEAARAEFSRAHRQHGTLLQDTAQRYAQPALLKHCSRQRVISEATNHDTRETMLIRNVF